MENMDKILRFGRKSISNGGGHRTDAQAEAPRGSEGRQNTAVRRVLRTSICLLLMISTFASSGCNMFYAFTAVPEHWFLCKGVSNAVGLKIPYNSLELKFDTHGGFLGDGLLFAVARLDSDAEEEIKQNSAWKAFPMSDEAERLAYDYLDDYDGNEIFPRIENGYYIIIDRYDDDGSGKAGGLEDGDSDSEDGESDLDHGDGGAAKPVSKDPEAAIILGRYSFNFTMALYDVETCTLYYAELDT